MNSKPSCLAVFCCQTSSPNGQPRRTDLRKASNSPSLCTAFTRPTQFLGRGITDREYAVVAGSPYENEHAVWCRILGPGRNGDLKAVIVEPGGREGKIIFVSAPARFAQAPDVAARLVLVDLQREKDRVCFGTLSSLALVINHGHRSSMCQPDERSFAWATGSVGEAEGCLLAEMDKALAAWLDGEIQEAAQRRQAAEAERAQHQADLELARAMGGDDGVQLYELLDRHDWSYEYSDDGTVWKRGRAQQQQIVDLMRKLSWDAALAIWSRRAPQGFCVDAYLAAT